MSKKVPFWSLQHENYKVRTWIEAGIVLTLTAISTYFLIAYTGAPKSAWCEAVFPAGMPWAGLWFMAILHRAVRDEKRH